MSDSVTTEEQDTERSCYVCDRPLRESERQESEAHRYGRTAPQDFHPRECTNCDGQNGERVDTQHYTSAVVDVYVCEDCYVRWEVVSTFRERSDNIEPGQ